MESVVSPKLSRIYIQKCNLIPGLQHESFGVKARTECVTKLQNHVNHVGVLQPPDRPLYKALKVVVGLNR